MNFVCKVDKKLVVPKTNSLPNKETLVFDLKAGKPIKIGDGKGEIPEVVANTYAESYKNVYSIIEDGQQPAQTATPATPPAGTPAVEFDAIAYFEAHPEATEEELVELKQKELLDLCTILELTGSPNESKAKLAAKIAQELKIRKDNEKGD